MAKKIKIAVDAGHGSNTAGKRTPDGYREHWINVKCAYYCRKALIRSGFSVLKVGWDDADAKDDSDVSLTTRQKQIKNAKCDASVSFHANAHGNGKKYTSANGAETLIHVNNSKDGDSAAFAKCIQKRLVKGTTQSNRGVKEQELAMCNCIAMGVDAAALVEIGFMTNEREAELMKTDAFCKEQGEDVARGVCDYYGVDYVKEESTQIKAGDKVKIMKGAVYGGAAFGKVISSAHIDKKYTVTKVQKNNNQEEALIKELNSWVATKYLKK